MKIIQSFPFKEGFAMVKFNDNSWGYINKDGKIIAKGFKDANSFYEGFAMVRFNDYSYGFINKDGKIISKGFKDAWPFKEEFAMVKFNDNSYGFINKDGKIIAKGFKNAWTFNEGFAMVKFNDYSWGYLSKDLKFYDNDKKTLIPNNDPILKEIKFLNMKQTKQEIIEEISNKETELSLLKDKLAYMQETGSEEIDENEFRVWRTLSLFENPELSKQEKVKQIANLLK